MDKSWSNSPPAYKVLVIEDDSEDVLILRALLAEAERHIPVGLHVALTRANRLASGLQYLASEIFDLILLDLGLPESQGLATLKRVRAQVPQVAIIVLTGLDDEVLALEAVRQGAQDYLVKGQTDAHLLRRALGYATERQRLQLELEAAREREEMERERAEQLRSAQQFATMADAPGWAGRDKTDVLSTGHIQEFAQTYQGLIACYVQAVRQQEERPWQELRAFAVQLAALKASARDIVRIHLAVLEQFSGRAIPAEENAFSKDARLALVELMGNLMDLYRQASLEHKAVERWQI